MTRRRGVSAALASGVMAVLAACAPGGESDSAPFAALDSIASPAAAGSGEPNLTTGPDGRVYMTWLEPAGDSLHALRLAVRDGAGWSAPRTIVRRADLVVNWADFPSLVVLPDGRLAAHWLQRSDTVKYAYDVRIAQSGDGGITWSEPVTPHLDASPTEHGFASLWDDEAGLSAIWLDGRKYGAKDGGAKEMMLIHTTITPAGSRGREVTVDDRICDCCQTSAARTARGPVVVYRDRTADEIRDISIVRQVDGQWTAPATVHADGWKIAACPVNGPAVAARGERVAVAWFTAPGDTARVNVAFSGNSGATFGAPVRVDGGTPAGRVDIALLPDGDALVSWIERTGGDTAAVRARRVTPAGEAGEPVTIAASSAARASGFPRIAATEDEVIFAWTVPGETSAIRVARGVLPGGDE